MKHTITNFRQRGFAAIVAILLIGVLAALGVALIKTSTTQQSTSAMDIQTGRAWQAARAGTEWGLYQALRSKACAASTQLDLTATAGFRVGVACSVQTYNNGESAPGVPLVISIYTIEATACNSTTACPDNTLASSARYIERKRVVMACDTASGTGCN